MKVLHLLSSNRYSGAENVVCQMIHLFQPDIDMVYCSPDGPIRDSLASKEIPYLPIRSLSKRDLRKVIDQYQPDLIHAHDIRASVIAAQFSNEMRVISHIHCNFKEMSRISLKSLVYRFFIKKYRHIFTVSKSIITEYRFSSTLEKKASVLYNIVDEEKIREMATAFHVSESYDGIFLGRLSHQKNPQRLMKIMSGIIKQIPTARFVVIGDGSLLEETKNVAKELNISSHIDFKGYLENPFPYLKASKLMLMSSRMEGTPMCILESMALGVPVISTGVDGIREIIHNGVDGFYFNSNEEIVNSAYHLIKNEVLRKQISQQAVAKSLAINNPFGYKEKLLAVYENNMGHPFKGKSKVVSSYEN